MASVKKTVRIRVRTSFNNMEEHDEAEVELNVRVQGWLSAGLVEVIEGGQSQARPRSAEPSADEG